MAQAGPIHIMGAGLSGLAAATTLAKAGVEVHVHDVRVAHHAAEELCVFCLTQ